MGRSSKALTIPYPKLNSEGQAWLDEGASEQVVVVGGRDGHRMHVGKDRAHFQACAVVSPSTGSWGAVCVLAWRTGRVEAHC